MKRLKIKWNIMLAIAFIILAIIFIHKMCSSSNQAMMAVGLDVGFEGQFSYDEESWYDIDKNKISGKQDSIVLKGKFKTEMDVEGELLINMYSSHIVIEIYEGDTMVFRHHPTYDGQGLEMCGNCWIVWPSDILGRDAEVMVRLTNCHEYANANAYEEFVDSFYIAPEEILEEKIASEYEVQRNIGIFTGIAGIVFIIILITCLLLKVPTSIELWVFSAVAICMGVYTMLDNPAVNMGNRLIVFNTNVHLISLLCTVLFLMIGFVGLCSDVVQKVLNICVVAYGAFDLFILSRVAAKKVLLWDMLKYWAVITIVLFIIVMAFATISIKEKKNKKVVFAMFSILGISLLIELINGYFGIWDFGIVFKTVYYLVFAIQLVMVFGYLIMNHGAYAKSKMLEHDLEHSRIVLSLGQIKNHFIFNVLNAISGMCKNEPEKADETIILFSRYLRNNMAVLEDGDMVSFEEVLSNLRDYIGLEKIRFEEKITYIEDIQISNFVMPQMLLQPLVENSLKHGILPKAEGGTIRIEAYREKGNVIIKVIDDGIGFDQDKGYAEDSLGIHNVQFRLKHMINGKLDIKSELGKGTVASITIPFRER